MKSKRNSHDASMVSTLVAVFFAATIALTASEATPFTRLFHPTETAEATSQSAAITRAEVRSTSDALFGPDAVNACRERCAVTGPKNLALCNRSCQRLSLAEYGRRVSLVELDPGRDAATIANRCANQSPSTRAHTAKDFEQSVSTALGLIESTTTDLGQTTFGGARLRHSSFSEARKRLATPNSRNTEQTKLVQQLSLVTCLHTHLALTEQGVIIAGENADSFSRRFYQRLHHALRGKLEPAQARIQTLHRNAPMGSNS